MFTNSKVFLCIIALFVTFLAACSSSDAQRNTNTASVANSSAPKPAGTPRNDFKPADIAKLKWIEGSWRGMDGEKPFYERYRITETSMIVESLKEDGSAESEPEAFELKNGEFGKGDGEKRSAASEITDSSVQFVPAVAGRGNNFRFEKQDGGTWRAVLEWPATADKPARQKIYLMEPWTPKK